MHLEPVVPIGNGFWEQTIADETGPVWTIRVRRITLDGDDVYECWINTTRLPATWRRRDAEDEQGAVARIMAIGRQSFPLL